MIRVNDTLSIGEDEITEKFIRARGPGGQNVNKVASAAQLRFRARSSPSLPPAVIARLEQLAGFRMTRDGEIVITSDRFRTQAANRKDALERLVRLIDQASHAPRPRIPTQPSRSVIRRRADAKSRRSRLKQSRRERVPIDD